MQIEARLTGALSCTRASWAPMLRLDADDGRFATLTTHPGR